VPLRDGGGDIANHVAHDVRDDEPADRGCDEDRDGREDIDNETGEGETVRRGEMARQADGSQNEDEKTDHGQGVGDGRGYGEMLELCGRKDTGCRGMNSHGNDAADGACDEGDSRLTIVCHVKYCREESGFRRSEFAPGMRYGTNEAFMSGNVEAGKSVAPKTTMAKVDRRVLRTRDTLGDALVELMQEKTFDDITVQDVLDRAGVGRSTFYAHYRDKDDLFLSDVEDFLEMMATLLTRHGVRVERVAPVAELFGHIAEVREFVAALVASGKMQDVLELGQGFFARSIEERLLLARVEMEPAKLKAHAYALAGALFSLLDWWVDHGMTEKPEAMDALYHRMVWNGLKPG
jgi:AcrR family transcriptional regulator